METKEIEKIIEAARLKQYHYGRKYAELRAALKPGTPEWDEAFRAVCETGDVAWGERIAYDDLFGLGEQLQKDWEDGEYDWLMENKYRAEGEETT